MTCAIEARAVSKTFRVGSGIASFGRQRRTVEALVDISFAVNQGEIFGLVGRNGYGKTTLIKCICSLIEPTVGTIEVLGHDAHRQHQASRARIGYVGSDERSFYWRLTGRQNLLFFSRLHGLERRRTEQRITSLAETFGVQPLLDRRFMEYSTGNRQRLSIVRALLHEPLILILDEPTRSLDPFAADSLRQTLMEWMTADLRRSVLITSHNLSEVEQLSHRVGIMSRGRLREVGTLSELRAKFDDREHIRVLLDAVPEFDSKDFGDVGVSGLTLSTVRGGLRCVAFRRRANDDTLDRVLRQALRLGSIIRSVERREMSLQDIIDKVDGAVEAS